MEHLGPPPGFFKVKGRKGQQIGEVAIETVQAFLDELWGGELV